MLVQTLFLLPLLASGDPAVAPEAMEPPTGPAEAAATTELASGDARPAVSVTLRGVDDDTEAQHIRHMLESSYRIVPEAEASMFVEVDVVGDALAVQVRDAAGVVSERMMSTKEVQLDLMVWLVVRDAFFRRVETAPPPPPPPTPPPVVVEPVRARGPGLGLAALGVASTGAGAFPELGVRGSSAFTLAQPFDLPLRADVDVGYRFQGAGVVDVHAFPIAVSVGVHLVPPTLEAPLVVVVNLRAEAAPKLAVPVPDATKPRPARADALLVELSLGPAVQATVPLVDDGDDGRAVSLVLELGAAAKLYRQSYVFADGIVDDSPYRAHVAAGVEVAWD